MGDVEFVDLADVRDSDVAVAADWVTGDVVDGDAWDEFTAELDKRDTESTEFVALTVPGSRIVGLYDPSVTFLEYETWRKNSMVKGVPDPARVNCLMLSAKCRGLVVNGKPLTEDNGAASTWSSQKLLTRYNVKGGAAVVKLVYKTDPAVADAGEELLREAGYKKSGEDAEADPFL